MPIKEESIIDQNSQAPNIIHEGYRMITNRSESLWFWKKMSAVSIPLLIFVRIKSVKFNNKDVEILRTNFPFDIGEIYEYKMSVSQE